jgi:DNA (cytosine-5)-methyltransferase 1
LDNNTILTVKELAQYLKIAEKTAYRFASEGKIPAFKIGGSLRFRKLDIDNWIAGQCKEKDEILQNSEMGFVKAKHKTTPSKKGPSAIDLFCGAGGLSLGFMQAGANILAGIDNDAEALLTFKKNLPQAQTINYDLGCISPNLVSDLEHVDLMLGGPPCQGFSIAGKRDVSDPRNQLTKSYLKLVSQISPKAVVIENVPNILSMGNGEFASNIIHGLEKLGFRVEVLKLNAAEFGVPQNRKRVFFIAHNKKYSILKTLEEKKTTSPITTKEALSDLPLLTDNLGSEKMPYSNMPQNEYQILMRNDSEWIFNHQAVDHKPKTKMIIGMVPDGGNYKNLPIEYQSTRKVNIAWTRMNSKRPCFTIDAGHNHHFHYEANRVPTVRECARLQSFPDIFVFQGKRTSQYRQVGNAVPPLLAKQLAEALFEDGEF